jgi:type I restriction enzyme S subunit
MTTLSLPNWQIPNGWELISIGDITSDWRGGAPLKPEDFTEEGFPILHKGAIQKCGRIAFDERKKIFTTLEYANRHQRSVIDRSYMVVTLRDLVPTGPSIGLIANLAQASSPKYILAQGAYGFQVDASRVDPTYLMWLSNYEGFRGYIKRFCVGSTQIHIRTPVFQEVEIPLPPLDEQRRIAAILDKADTLREKRRQAIAKLDTLQQAVFLEMFGDPATNPKGWSIVKFGDRIIRGPQNGLYKPKTVQIKAL